MAAWHTFGHAGDKVCPGNNTSKAQQMNDK